MTYSQQQPFSGERRRYATRGTRQQANLHTFFECRDSLAESRLSDTQFCSGSGKAAFTSNCDKIKQIVKVAFHQTRLTLLIRDRKSTRLNSSHLGISYAVFCL